jgi:hypothetical protein
LRGTSDAAPTDSRNSAAAFCDRVSKSRDTTQAPHTFGRTNHRQVEIGQLIAWRRAWGGVTGG